LPSWNLFHILEELISKKKLRDIINNKSTIVAIGPVTAETLFEMGFRVDNMPKKYTFEETLIELARY